MMDCSIVLTASMKRLWKLNWLRGRKLLRQFSRVVEGAPDNDHRDHHQLDGGDRERRYRTVGITDPISTRFIKAT
jgi:hypothetical protein